MVQRIALPRSKALNRTEQADGTWRLVEHGDEPGLWIVIVKCPKCGRCSTLHQGPAFAKRLHEIANNGDVSPSVVCPYDATRCPDDPCDWHVYVTLQEWIA